MKVKVLPNQEPQPQPLGTRRQSSGVQLLKCAMCCYRLGPVRAMQGRGSARTHRNPSEGTGSRDMEAGKSKNLPDGSAAWRLRKSWCWLFESDGHFKDSLVLGEVRFLLRSTTDWMRPTPITEGNLL